MKPWEEDKNAARFNSPDAFDLEYIKKENEKKKKKEKPDSK